MAETFEKNLYVGIDLDADAAMVSYSYEGEEPQTVSPMAGSEIFSIPQAMAYRSDGSFSYGEEANRGARAGQGILADHLLTRALRGEQIQLGEELYSYTFLLANFIKRMVSLAGRLGPKAVCKVLVLTVPVLDQVHIKQLQECVEFMELSETQVHIIDHKESFFHYGINQRTELSMYSMGLFSLDGEQMRFWSLERGISTRPQLMEINEKRYGFDMSQADELFCNLLPQAFEKQIFSSVYLVGDRFSDGWMKRSLQLLCQGRRVFLGKNLFSKGAAYAAMSQDQGHLQDYVYFGEHALPCNVAIKVYERSGISFFTLLSAGRFWYEEHSSCELIVDGTPTVDFWIQQPLDRQARIESVTLAELPPRENKTTRIKIDALPLSSRKVRITITDIGLGELVPGTDKKWEHLISF